MKKLQTKQRIRRIIILIMFLLFPIVLYYLSPALPIKGARQGIIVGSIIVFISLFVFSLIFGRLFCGWMCPVGGLQEACTIAINKKAKGGKLNWIKFFIWSLWLVIIIILLVIAGGPSKIDFFYETVNGISVSEPFVYIIYYVVVGLIFILSMLFGKRSFCHYTCWISPFMIIGNKIRSTLKYPSLHLSASKDKCIHCNLCTVNCPMSLEVQEMVKNNNMENSECILCGQCIDICPKDVIKYSFSYSKNISKNK